MSSCLFWNRGRERMFPGARAQTVSDEPRAPSQKATPS